jgi:hypothetical protein
VTEVSNADAAEGGERDVRREFVLARRKLSPKQRCWLKALPKYDFQYWRTCSALGYSKDTLHRWLRDADFRKALELLKERDELDFDIGTHRVKRNWEQQAKADLRLFFRPRVNRNGEPLKNGTFELIPPNEWTDEMAGMVQELSFDANGKPKLKLYSRQDATNTLAKYNKMVSDRHELSGPNGEALATTAPVVQVIIAKDDDEKPEPEG